ncbi:hypothetical protein M23134_07998 [Microscilla marina ATCC 23134]|uniref:Secretion system C-terminal sorting domain-containing protein n=2 Tax=Microscilla marina TaxID=1027 RepID=A1ZWM1_MICM2|nr:hypothetical protein M23134_07998 [Microscilla marina ATCC 23134]
MTNEEFGRYTVVITDAKGRALQVWTGTKTNKKLNMPVSVKDLAEGMYLVKVKMKKKEAVKKLLKK